MKTLLLKYWDRVRSSFWFVPSSMAMAAIALTFATVAVDELITETGRQIPNWIYTGGADGASLLMSTIAGSMITIAGVVFSMTLVALSLASSQLGPRILRNFMRDTSNQMVIGTFVSTFVYCLLVLRTIRRADETLFVPHLAVSIGVLLAVVSLAVLIYFIHHVAVSIQADQVIARVSEELIEGIENLFPEPMGESQPQRDSEPLDASCPAAFDREARPIAAPDDGYLNYVNPDALMELAAKEQLILHLQLRPGHYVVKGCPLVMVWPGERVTDQLVRQVRDAFILGAQRTATQDIEFSVNQLVEIAGRALSPGINDPFTAITCVDRLGSALCCLAQREIPSRYRFDEQGLLRIISRAQTFADIVDASFNQIRQHARTNAAVTIRLLETIAVIAQVVRHRHDRVALQRHASMIERGAHDGLPEEEDRKAVTQRYLAAVCILSHPDDEGD